MAAKVGSGSRATRGPGLNKVKQIKHSTPSLDIDTQLLQKLQELSEVDFTLQVLVPVLKTLGWGRVEYAGGPAEQGKDIICWREDEFGDPESAVAQVKKYKPTKKAADARSFSEIVTQLSQAIEKKLPFVNGQEYLPSQVYFISPYPLDTQTLQTRFEAVSALRPQRVKIMDGMRVVRLLKKNLPHLATQICGTQFNVRGIISSQLTNWDLMSALDMRTRRSVDTFYTDIDFSLGKETTRFFFHPSMKTGIVTEDLNPEDWPALKSLCLLAKHQLNAQVLVSSQEEIEKAYSRQRHLAESWQLQADRLKDKVREVETLLLDLRRVATPKRQELYRSYPDLGRLHDRAAKLSEELRALHDRQERSGTRDLGLEEELDLGKKIDEIFAELDKEDKIFRPIQRRLHELEVSLARLRKEEASLARLRPSLSVNIIIDGEPLAKALEVKRNWVESRIQDFNVTHPGVSELREFLLECKVLFDLAGSLLGNKLIARAMGIRPGMKYRAEASKARLKLSVHAVFETELNMLVLGDAGAGKTTSLQMYAFNHMSHFERLVLYVPLGRLVRVWGQRRVNDSFVTPLEEAITIFLCSLGASISVGELESELAARKSTILLDGLDEAIRFAPWIIESIVRFVDSRPTVQVITSSRIAGRYVEDMPFLTISLLPFTPTQRRLFVERWFAGDRSHIRRIERHLAKNEKVAEVIKTPLLATILCTLEENGIPLPDSEVRLFEERMRLLLGDYDVHKQAARLTSKRYHLALASRKIAFRLHASGKREDDRERLYSIAERALRRELGPKEARLVVDELVDPCNVLVPMTEDGKLGFGHLVYQEFLVAQELIANRSINLMPLLAQPWWRSALVLFARMCNEIEWLLRRLSVVGIGPTSVRETVISMINARPKEEIGLLKELYTNATEWESREDRDLAEPEYFDEGEGELYYDTYIDDLETPYYE